MMLSAFVKQKSIKNIAKWIFSVLCILFIAMLAVITIHNTIVGGGDTTPVAELCATYGAFASPECW